MRFLLESLESRRLLSLANSTHVSPAITMYGPSGASPSVTDPTPPAGSLQPGQVAVAYGLYADPNSGAGVTLAIVDAYTEPNIGADLARFDAQYGLPNPKLTVENQFGQQYNYPAVDAGWSQEIAMDVEWAHAIAPRANIVLVEANSTSNDDMMAAVQTASRQASVVSMSWGGNEFNNEAQYDSQAYFANPWVTFVAATGDDGGASGAEWPAASPFVVSVGGTSLYLNHTGAYGSETAWNASYSWAGGASGGAGGVSVLEPEPGFQTAALGPIYRGRATPDVSAVADPNTGLAVYDSVAGAGPTGWIQLGGTSAATPIWAGIFARADQAREAHGLAPMNSTQTLNLLYGSLINGSYGSLLHDVTQGGNYAGTARGGYDLATGLGTPIGNNLIAAAGTFSGALPAVAHPVTNPAPIFRHVPVHKVRRRDQPVEDAVRRPLPPPLFLIAEVPLQLGPVFSTGPTTNPNQIDTLSSNNAPSSGNNLARPTQPVPQPRFDLQLNIEDVSSSQLPPALDIYVQPIEQPEPPAAPAEVVPAALRWETNIDALFVDDSPASAINLPEVEPVPMELDAGNHALSTALASGVAIAVWGLWELRLRRTGGVDRRRWAIPLDTPELN
jgi:hypothetical protein